MPRPLELGTALRTKQGKLIREQRQFHKLTQAELGVAIGVTKTAVSLWEQGKTSPASVHQLRLAKALHTPWHILFGLDGEDVA